MKDKIVYILFSAWVVWGGIACEDQDFEQIVSATDDYLSESGGDYYEGGGIDVSHYERARIFPGLVDTLTEKRVDEAIVNIDASRRVIMAADVNLTVTPSAVYSTGLYAGAGEKITLVLDDDIKGLTAQIGIHSRDLSSLSGISYLERDPKIVTSIPLFKGKNEIRNPYGGYIWIKRSGSSNDKMVPIKVQGAYVAPDYVAGETGIDEWIEKINETTVPWIELRSEHLTFSVPVQYMKLKLQSNGKLFVTRMEEALRLWDDWAQCYNEFYGLDGVEQEKFPVPGFPFRVVMDAHLITERYSYYNDTNIELLRTGELIDVITDPELIKKTVLNTAHIMGWLQAKMFVQTYWPTNAPEDFKTMYSLMPNFYFLFKNGWWNNQNADVLSYRAGGSNSSIINATTYKLTAGAFDNLISFAKADSCKIYKDDAKVPNNNHWSAALSIYSAILSYKQEDTGKNGWKYFGYLNRFLVEESKQLVITKRLPMADAMLTCLTTYFERDFTQLFDRWGINISDDKRVEAIKYKSVEDCIWEYNPLEKNNVPAFDGKVFYVRSGKTPFRHVRTEWTAAAYSGEGENLKPSNYNYKNKNTPFNMFDGDRNTLWESYYDPYQEYKDESGNIFYPFKIDSLYYKATTPDYPYTVVVQPGEDQRIDVDGVYMAFGKTEEESIYNADMKNIMGDKYNYDKYFFRPQHIIVEVTNTPLEFNDVDTIYTNVQSIVWKKVYDSDYDLKGTSQQQFWPDRSNTFYIEFDQKEIGVTGIRLTMDKDSHKAKDRPADFPVAQRPKRPEFANKYLNRIQKMGEFGTFYFND